MGEAAGVGAAVGVVDVAVGVVHVAGWWHDVGAAALVGTARRPAPALPSWPVAVRADLDPAVALLDAVALGAAWRAAGVVPVPAEAPTPAAREGLPEAPARAQQLLEVVLAQPPGGASLQDVLVRAWLIAAAEHGYRLPHSALTQVLGLATGKPHLRRLVVPVIGERGRWLAALDPALGWVGSDGAAAAPAGRDDPADGTLHDRWSRMGIDERVAELSRLRGRAHRPDLARTLVASTWSSDPARVRTELLRALTVGLGPDDEPLLEAALDDRASGVRDVAADLLDRLPGSARAGRMGARLASLLSTSGLVRKSVRVADPSDPDAAGVRDGLRPPPKGVSRSGYHRRVIIAGAPIATWTTSTGLRPDQVFRALPDDETRLLLRTAVLHQGEGHLDWIRAAFDAGPSAALVPLLPEAERPEAVATLLRGRGRVDLPAQVLDGLPGPWDDELSTLVVVALERGDGGAAVLAGMRSALAERLSPAVADRLRTWAGREATASVHARAIGAVAATITTRQSVHDAFSGDHR